MISEYFKQLLEPCIWLIIYVFIPLALTITFINWWYPDINVIKRYRSKGHGWRSIQMNKSVLYDTLCSVCEKLMLPSVGQYCERCALSACRDCRKIAEKQYGCRTLTASLKEPFYHHWIKVGATCDDCSLMPEEGRNEYLCSWCQRLEHCAKGVPSKTVICDFGDLQSCIIPPTHVKISRTGAISVTPPDWKDWQPLIVIGNPLSGGGAGDDVLSSFRGYLNPLQVIRLTKKGLKSAINWIPPSARIIVAGGDGSVSAVLSTIADMKTENSPAVGILPLGTGNDLSRVLGWGGTCPEPFSALSFVDDIKRAKLQSIDRWSVHIGRRQLYAYNYISIGVDARVALDFHRARLHPLYVRGSQSINYLIYLCLGTQQVLSQDCHGLEKLLEVTLDGNVMNIPPLQALLLQNIPSWGAGVDVWNTGADGPIPVQNYNDGKLEVLGITSSFHIAKLQIGLSQPNRIGQASDIIIKLKGLAPMQVDGEPWEQGPCEIHVTQAGTVSVLQSSPN